MSCLSTLLRGLGEKVGQYRLDFRAVALGALRMGLLVLSEVLAALESLAALLATILVRWHRVFSRCRDVLQTRDPGGSSGLLCVIESAAQQGKSRLDLLAGDRAIAEHESGHAAFTGGVHR